MKQLLDPDRAERATLRVIFARRIFGQIQALLVVGEPLCNVGTTSSALLALLRVI